jgi:hypothetical protein
VSERRYGIALLILGHGVFIALLVLSWKYAVLRSTFGDTAFQVFQWISQPGWDIEAHRYTAVLPQACVKFFALFGPELRTLLLIASLVQVLVGYGIYLLCAHVWKSPVAAFGCAMAAVLCSRLAFYSPVLEANYLLCYPFLLIGFMERNGREERLSSWKVGLSMAFLLVPLIVHPVGWMVMLFCTVFMSVLGWLRGKTLMLLIALSALWPLIARGLFPPTGYEMEQYEAIAKGLHRIGSIAHWGSWEFLSMHTFSASNTYLPALLVLVVVVGGWSFLREMRPAVMVLGGAVAFIAVFLVTFHEGNSAIMQDRGVLPLATIIALPAAALMVRIKSPRFRTVALVLAALVLFIKVRDVSFASRPFVKQYAVTEELITLADDQGIARGIVDCQHLRERDAGISWAFPVETLLRSALRGPGHRLVLVCSDNLPAQDMLASGQVQVLQFAWVVDENGNNYFQRSDAPYRPVIQH